MNRPCARSLAPSVLALAAALCCAPAAQAATLTVGPGMAYARPCLAFAAARSGDTVEIEAGAYPGELCRIAPNFLTIRGMRGRVRIDAQGRGAEGKGAWIIAGNDVTVENVEIFNTKVADKNGAALRIEGSNFTLKNSFLHDNENGVLTGASPTSRIVIENSEFGHNGDGSGQTHNVYVGDVASLTFRFNFSHDANIGHNLKSRARINTIIYNRFSSLAPGEKGSTAAGRPSFEIDLPNAGAAYVMGNIIEQPADNDNNTLLAYGNEGSGANDMLYVMNNTFLNDDKRNGVFVRVHERVKARAHIQNNIFAGKGIITNQGSAVDKHNYAALEVDFVDRANYVLVPTENAKIINAGAEPPMLPSGVALRPIMQYKHPAGGMQRPAVGALDIGAYQAVIVEKSKKSWYQGLLK
jgi:hypothetical protein